MKTIKFLSMAMLCFFISTISNAQIDKITYPVNGSIFQQNDAGQYSLSFGGTSRKETSLPNLRYTIYKKNSSGSFTAVNNYSDIEINPSNSKTNIVNRSIFSYSNITLDKGFYRIKIFSRRQFGIFWTKDFTKDIIEFGIGDVYFISGQSNAAGFNYPNGYFVGHPWRTEFPKTGVDINSNENASDATVPFVTDNSSSPLSRIFNYDGKHEWHAGWPVKPNNAILSSVSTEGLPFKNKFEEFKNGTNRVLNPVRIYPNGMSSWCWQPLGKRLATNSDPIISNTPNLFFNVAFPGASLEAFLLSSNDNDGRKMFQTMQLFGNILGAKAVLWHQGETNSLAHLLGGSTISSYKSNLSNVIEMSRNALKDPLSNPKLSWYVSNASYFTFTDNSNAQNLGFIKSSTNGNLRNGITNSYTLGSLISEQTPNSNDNAIRIYPGITSDDITGLARDSDVRLHFSGNSALNDVANRWYDKIKANYQIGGVVPTPMVPISYVTKINSTDYEIEVEKTDGNKYYWCKNNNGIVLGFYSAMKTGANANKNIFTSTNEGDILTCYIEDNNGRFFACQSFIVADPNAKYLNSSQGSFNFGSSGGTDAANITSQNIDWDVVNKPSWVNLDFDSESLNLIISCTSNNEGARSGNVTLQEVNGGSVSTNISIFQSSGSNTSVPLTSITPASNSGWYKTNASVDNNTMQVSGVQSFQGFGVQANNSLFFNIGGQYSNFTGKVGRDDEADNSYNSGNVQFTIKGDGATLWTSSIHGNTTNAETFNVNVSGKTTIELYTDITNDNNYFDHGDWIDLFLTTGSGTTCTNSNPTNVYANPTSVSSGGGNSTLYATCSAGTTPTWSTGQTGASVVINLTTTTNYTVACVGNSCNPSNPASVSVTVPPAGGCSNITDNLNMASWNVNGHPLIARQFHNQMWLTQRIGTNPESFLVRGSSMLTRNDISNTSYSSQVGCFAWVANCSECYGGLATPNSTQFPTPSGFTLAYECSQAPCSATNGTPYYTAINTQNPSICTSSVYLNNSWTYASAGYNPPPKIGTNIGGNNMAMGGVNYSSTYPNTGIGTHTTSEIIYDLGASHPYSHFLATVGKDNSSLCGSQYGQEKLLFKVINNANGAVLATSPYLGNPNSGLAQTADISASISGVRYLKLVVEDGGDGGACDWANWARARLACSANGRVAATDSTEEIEFMSIVPNPNSGQFDLMIYLEEDSGLEISLMNSNGQIYESTSSRGKKGMNSIPYKTQKVSSGNYVLRVVSNSKTESRILVIE